MRKDTFIGRQAELEQLKVLYARKRPSFIVIKGRRRIGKSRLIAEFASRQKYQRFLSFAGLAPHEGLSDQEQRDHFARQLAFILKVPPLTFLDWSDAFEHLSLHLKPGDIRLLSKPCILVSGRGQINEKPACRAEARRA